MYRLQLGTELLTRLDEDGDDGQREAALARVGGLVGCFYVQRVLAQH